MDLQITNDLVVFEGKKFVIVDIEDKLPKHPNFPGGAYDIEKPWSKKPAVSGSYCKITKRDISILYCHQTAGSVTKKGFDAPLATAQFVINNPSWKRISGKWIWTGRGRGWPGIPYTYYIPYKPMYYRYKVVIFRCWHNDQVTWHSSHNRSSISIVCQGYFKSRHIKTFRARRGCPDGEPSKDQMTALMGFIQEYAIDELGIDHKQIKGHTDSPYPKLSCPGDHIESYYRGVQQGIVQPKLVGSAAALMPMWLMSGELLLDTWEERQAALVLIGHDIGNYGKKRNGVDGDPGYATRCAIEAQEEQLGLQIDGYWDDAFDHMIKIYLIGLGIRDEDIQALIP